MKTLIVECKFVIEVPWDEEAWGSPYFQIEENGCPGTGAVNEVLEPLMEAADKNSICWACAVSGTSKILSIEDRKPRNYVKEITFKKTEKQAKCRICDADITITIMKNAGITEESWRCECGAACSSMNMRIGNAENS